MPLVLFSACSPSPYSQGRRDSTRLNSFTGPHTRVVEESGFEADLLIDPMSQVYVILKSMFGTVLLDYMDR